MCIEGWHGDKPTLKASSDPAECAQMFIFFEHASASYNTFCLPLSLGSCPSTETTKLALGETGLDLLMVQVSIFLRKANVNKTKIWHFFFFLVSDIGKYRYLSAFLEKSHLPMQENQNNFLTKVYIYSHC